MKANLKQREPLLGYERSENVIELLRLTLE
mgnify:CR=1 FL=1